MTKKIKGSVWLPVLIVALGLSAMGFGASALMSHSQPSAIRSRGYVNRGRLSPRLTLNLNALGNRLEKPGKERLTITGELRSSSDSLVHEITATLEFPDQVRLKGQLSSEEPDLIESLTYDSAEHFFNAQMQGNAMRFLGSRFRTDDGSNPDYNGPYFDIYKIADRIDASGQERAAKLYYFNSDTFLLERVTYVINRNGSQINIETKLSDWRDEDGQKVARRIERLENGKSVFALNIGSVQFGKRDDDGIFQPH